jgi:hypothetical protein
VRSSDDRKTSVAAQCGQASLHGAGLQAVALLGVWIRAEAIAEVDRLSTRMVILEGSGMRPGRSSTVMPNGGPIASGSSFRRSRLATAKDHRVKDLVEPERVRPGRGA